MMVLATAASSASCKKTTSPVEPKQALPAAPAEPALDLARLPEFVDKDLFQALHNIVKRCEVDIHRSEISCNDGYFDNIALLYRRRMQPRHTAMQTVAYVFENGDDKLKTAAAEFLYRALRWPTGTLPDKATTLKLIGHLGSLPGPQAMDAAPAVAQIAVRAELEDLLFTTLDKVEDRRVAAAGYRHIMAEGRMRVFDKVFTLAGDKNLELAVAAVESVRNMGGRTLEENAKVCDWMKELLTDGRPLIETRAAGILTGCGPKYLELVLASDEKRWAAGKPLNGGLDIYGSVCGSGEKHHYGAPAKAQCGRLKKLATSLLNDTKTREADRVQALGLLADQFPGKDTLALATRFADEKEPAALFRRAQNAVRDLGGAPRPERVE
jgi:hypothetical protein